MKGSLLRFALPALIGALGLAAFVSASDSRPTPTSGPGQASPAIREAIASSGLDGESGGAASPAPPGPAVSGEAPLASQAQALDGGALRQASAPLRLSTTLEPTQGKWLARWTLTNEGRAPLYVATQLPALRGGRTLPSPHRLYVRALEGTLHLSKRLWRIPRLVSPFVRELPYLERLDPGQSLEGAVRIPPLVAESYPYQDARPQEARLVREVVISFGFFNASAEPRPVAGAPGLYQVPYARLEQQRLVESPPHAARLSVR